MGRTRPGPAALVLVVLFAFALAGCELAERIVGIAAAGRSDAGAAGGGLVVTSPNGGERWQAGERYAITWSCTSQGAAVSIELLDGGLLRQSIVEGIADYGCHTWTVPAELPDSTGYAVRVRLDDEGLADESDGTFAISSRPSIGLIAPNGEAALEVGRTCTVRWQSSGAGEFVKIDLLRGGELEGAITAGTPNDGSHDWTVSCEEPSPPEGSARGRVYSVRVTSVSLPYLADASDTPFEIREPRRP